MKNESNVIIYISNDFVTQCLLTICVCWRVKYGWFCQVCFTIKNKDVYNLILVESSSWNRIALWERKTSARTDLLVLLSVYFSERFAMLVSKIKESYIDNVVRLSWKHIYSKTEWQKHHKFNWTFLFLILCEGYFIIRSIISNACLQDLREVHFIPFRVWQIFTSKAIFIYKTALIITWGTLGWIRVSILCSFPLFWLWRYCFFSHALFKT
jgi:hypothetical protein